MSPKELDKVKELLETGKVIQSNDCWLYKGRKPTRYSLLKIGNKQYYIHRLSFEIFNGYCTQLSVLHKCDNKACYNPEHLFEGTQKDNVHDAINKGRFPLTARTDWKSTIKFCPRKHEYTPENTYRQDGARSCRECRRLRSRGLI